MKTLICSNVFGDFDQVNALTRPVNEAYAVAHGYDYLVDAQKRCGKEVKSFWWEKIAFLRSVLSSRESDDLIVWCDVDSLIQSATIITDILPPNKDFGMVPIYAGMNRMERQDWYNAGVIAMRNTTAVKGLIEAVWERRSIDKDDETAILKELRGSDVNFKELDPKWNCWMNNSHLVSIPAIVTFHGIYPATAKVAAIAKFLGK